MSQTTPFAVGIAMFVMAVFILLVLRRFRPSQFALLEARAIEDIFRATVNEKLGFFGKKATIVFEDRRLDWFAPGEFLDSRCPVSAVKIAKNQYNVYFLWAYSDVLAPEPVVSRLSNASAEELLGRKHRLLKDTYPADAATAAGKPPSKRLRGS